MIVTHHPLFFGALSRLDEDAPTGRLAARLIRMGVTVYSAHTNLDRAAGGVNDRLAEALGAIDIVVPEGQFSSGPARCPSQGSG
jgi:putative NIF3 family GTP cyclohydrolase 1 type 2